MTEITNDPVLEKYVRDDRNLALWFTPDAIREHFEDGPVDLSGVSDDALRLVGLEALSGDVLYAAFHESLVLALEDIETGENDG